MFNTYASIMASKPTVFQSQTLGTISAIAGPVGAGFQLYGNVSNLVGTWTGSGQQAQGSQASGLLGQGQQVLTAITQTQQIINAGAQQLQNAKMRLEALTKGATTEGFRVLPVGKVILGALHWKKIAFLHAHNRHAEARILQAQLVGRAASYSGQIDMVVLQTNAADAQVALTLANSAVSILGSLTQKDSSAANPTTGTALPPGVVAPGAGTQSTPVTAIAGGTPPTGIGTGLASAGSLGGAGALGLGLTGAGAPAAGLNPSVLGGTAGLAPGMVAGRGALAGEVVAGGGAGMNPAMMYGAGGMGGGHMPEDGKDREGSEWLEEDGESWQTADAANEAGGVLS